MKLYRMEAENSRVIAAFGSSGANITPILQNASGCHVSHLKLAAGGHLGLHPAVGEQVFMVLEGEGWVEGEAGEHVVIRAGDAAFWKDGEHHQSGSELGLTALLIEGDELVIRLSLQASESEKGS
ncbi:cupin domain-containing protein [Paenibacillus sp. MABNR03]|uniref:cupin domain-containing protein n=1 Tax=Paenibacillus sp. MABNR03 TaxID=3142626 RepID=UPI003D2B7F15